MDRAASQPRGVPSPGLARLALAGLAALVAAGILDPLAPSPAPVDAPAERFSAGRAFELVEALASEPHPLDSEANDRVRLRIEQRLDELGVAWEELPWSTPVRVWWDLPAVRAEGVNLLARLPGSGDAAERGVVLFVAHYDARSGIPVAPTPPADGSAETEPPPALRDIPRTRHAPPGAGDDGAAVAAFLEALRALKQGPPLANELWFLITDGEEYGMLGAEAFARREAALERVEVVLNFEGRGNAGPVVLFETGHDDAAWVEAYARAVRWPLATSLGPTVYERMPNDSDFSVFKGRGIGGLNFAFIGGGSAYHQPADTPGNLDRRSLQHHGEIVLGLARHLGAADLAELRERTGVATFFTLPGNVLVRYPRPWEAVFAGLALLATLGALVFGVRSRALRPSGVLLASLAWPVLTALAGGSIVALAWLADRSTGRLIHALGAATDAPARGNLLSSTLTAVGAAAAAVFLATLLARWTRRTWTETLASGALVGWTLLALIAVAVAPGCAHAFVWPAFFTALGLHATLRARVLEISGPSAWLGPLLACLPVLLVLLPVIKLFAQVGSVAHLGPAILATVPSALVLGLLPSALRPLVIATPRLAQLGAGALALAAMVAGAGLAAMGL